MTKTSAAAQPTNQPTTPGVKWRAPLAWAAPALRVRAGTAKATDGDKGEVGPGEEDLTQREVKWSALPERLVVAEKPVKLDGVLVGRI